MKDPSRDLDPGTATSAAFARRTFVGIATATLAAGGTALAQDDLGKPHPPFVAEDDAGIVVERPTLDSARAGGIAHIDAYAASPKGVAHPPAVVIAMHIWGVDAQIRDTVRRLAKAGYAAIAPNLYAGLDAPSGDGLTDMSGFRDAAGKLADANIDADLASGAAWLRAQHEARAVGVMGFCMGGAMTLRQTVDRHETYAAAAVFYGKVRYGTTGNNGTITPIALAYADEIAVPAAGSWGGRDTSILAEDVGALDGRLTALHTAHDFKVYPEAGHGFFDDTRSSYVASAASDAWTRTLAWFARYLR